MTVSCTSFRDFFIPSCIQHPRQCVLRKARYTFAIKPSVAKTGDKWRRFVEVDRRRLVRLCRPCCGRRCRQSWTCSTRSTLSKVGHFCRPNVERPFDFVASVYWALGGLRHLNVWCCKKSERCTVYWWKWFDDMLNRFDSIPACYIQKDRHLSTAQSTHAMDGIARQKCNLSPVEMFMRRKKINWHCDA